MRERAPPPLALHANLVVAPCRVVHEGSVLAAGLGDHHRVVRTRDELPGAAGVLRGLGDADRDGDAPQRSDAPAGDRGSDSFGQLERLCAARARHDHRELLAAHPADMRVGAGDGHQRLRHHRQHVVSDTVPVDVVDALEVVDVQHQKRHWLRLGATELQIRPQLLLKGSMVDQPRQGVGSRLVDQPLLEPSACERDRSCVGEPADEL
jgi:hypothetical protein